jgi:hypothetical protein
MPIGRARTLIAAIGTAVAVTIAAVGCASTPTHHAVAHVAATATPTLSATPTPTPAAPLTSTASVTRKHPIVGTKVGILVSTVPRARITVVAHFYAGDRKKKARADETGVHTFWFPTGSATPGYRVRVDVRVSANGQTRSNRTSFTPRPKPPPPAPAPGPTTAPPPAPSGCYPKTDGGNCYEPGEFCRTSDHGMSGVAGDGEAITCEDNNGWRWEPT